MYGSPMTPSLICCCTWWRRNGSWIFPSCSSRSMGGCRTSSSSPNSSRFSARGSSRPPWQLARGSSQEGPTQVHAGFWVLRALKSSAWLTLAFPDRHEFLSGHDSNAVLQALERAYWKDLKGREAKKRRKKIKKTLMAKNNVIPVTKPVCE